MKQILFLLFTIFSVMAIAQTQSKKKMPSVEEVVGKVYGGLEKTALENNVIKPKLNLGMELLRTDKNGKQILIKKSEYPLGLIKTKLFNPNNFKLSIYEGNIKIPLHIYSPDKNELALKSKKIQQSEFSYEIEIIPIKKKEKIYTFQLRVGQIYNHFAHYIQSSKKEQPSGYYGLSYSKEIEIELGESLKIDANNFKTFKWYVEDVVGNNKIVFDSDKDYYNYFNDYLILSLESDK
jgi:hypothetical protein